MTFIGYLIAAVFLPLFPFSMLFNRLFAEYRNPWVRSGLVLLWPQLGVLAMFNAGGMPPDWLVWWGGATAAFYALRAVVLRDLGLWTGYLAISAWSLLWVTAAVTPLAAGNLVFSLQAAGFSAPLVLLVWLTAHLKSELGAAHAGACGGLAASLPRLSGVLVLGILAAVATPMVPGFFTLLGAVTRAMQSMPGAALLILTVWWLWAWGGVRIIGGFIVGPACGEPKRDLGNIATGVLGLALTALVLAGISLSGELI